MANETLRLKAELEDQFSAPMKRLRSELQSFQREGSRQMQDVTKVVGAVEGAFHSTARTATSVLNPAMMALGVTGLSAGAALAGITGALNKLSGNLGSIGQLSRDTGIAAKTLQEFSGVASRFNLTQDQVAQGAQTFADKMRVFSRGQGELWKWTLQQGTNSASRQAFQTFANDLAHTADEGEKLKKALSFGQTIKDPRGQRIFFQEFFGNADLSRIAQGQLGTVEQLFKQFRDKAGPFDPKSVQQAEDYERAINSLKGSMAQIGTTIAREVLPYVSGLAHYLDEAVKGERGPAIVAIRDAMKSVGDELGKVDWKTAGKEAGEAFRAILASLKPLAESLGKTVELIHALRTGSVTDVLRVTTGGQGTLGAIIRNIAPRAGDDEIAAKAEVEALKKELMTAQVDQETGGPALDFKSREPVLTQRLKDAEAELSRLQNRSPEQRQAEFTASMDKQRKALEENTDALKKRFGDATVQQQSFDATGTGGARFQTAAFGGGLPRFRGLPAPVYRDGGSGPGYYGEQGPAGPGAGRGFGGGRFNGLGGAGGGSAGGPIMPGVSANRGGASPVGRWWTGDRQQHAIDRLVAGGLSELGARALVARWAGVEAGGGPSSVNPKSGAFGIGQWLGARKRGIVGNTDFDAQIDHALRELRGPEARAFRQLNGARTEAEAAVGASMFERAEGYNPRTGVDNFTGKTAQVMRGLVGRRGGSGSQDVGADTGLFPNGAPRILKPDSMRDAPGLTMEQAESLRARMRGGDTRRAEVLADPNDERRRADGSFYSDEDDRRAARDLGIALRFRKAQEDQKAAELRLNSARVSEAAGRSGLVGSNVNGSVTTVIERAGPDAKVRSDVKGNLFGKVVTVNGRQMQKAD